MLSGIGRCWRKPLKMMRNRLSTFSVQKNHVMKWTEADEELWCRMYGNKPILPVYDKILIANRGEIACRIIRTCRRHGIKVVSVFSESDANALHVRMADEAVCIGGAASTDSYLQMDRIVDVCKLTSAQAVHPGYGFLSENTIFASKLEEANVDFIGPPSTAIQSMGDKLESKRIAMNANVNIVPGFDGILKDENDCINKGKEIGYPVMVKASAGGGGKGMRIANNESEVKEAYNLSKNEAKSSFGDDRLLIEKFVNNPRHIEFQILADKHGNVLHLNERECSIQRRNQKVVEEAPSPYLTEELRKAMGEQAIALAKEVGYCSAGTVEFLVDDKKNFYFLEMNTRLQVEHPITEAITGIDIVHEMLKISSGKKLEIEQKDVPIDGWAIECRVYAEDPTKQFGLPSIGRLHRYEEPKMLCRKSALIRCDSGVEEGSEISVHYDPMICKLVTHSNDRLSTIEEMKKALDKYVIHGVTHNISLLRDIIEQERFVSGDLTTSFLSDIYGDSFESTINLNNSESEYLISMAHAMYMDKLMELSHDKLTDIQLTMSPDSHLNSSNYLSNIRWISERKYEIELWKTNPSSNNLKLINKTLIDLNGITRSNILHQFNDNFIQLNFDDPIDISKISLSYRGAKYKFQPLTLLQKEMLNLLPEDVTEKAKIRATANLKNITAHMPGVVRSISVNDDDMVASGQQIIVIEAMKMQNAINSSVDSKVKKIHAKVGDAVAEGDLLVELE
ncbi:hypothetical protein SNEBB_001828 [Seison nebaliae]|nr:hypothetical protein SNEBB_001828 [Seison nebaliae]